jgi:TATA-box binding protein (TBP) (component of TFIID and TFIIIB)
MIDYNGYIINDIIQNTIDTLMFHLLPDDVNISTMTFVCSLNVNFNCKNIAKYIDLSYNDILSVRCGDTLNRTLINKKKAVRKKTKKKENFYNQVSLYIIVKNKDKTKPINLKIFKNGALQMTGCKNVENCLDALSIIFGKLKSIKGKIIKNKIKEIQFTNKPNELLLSNLIKFKIAMINSNFNIGFIIERSKLYNLLTLDKIECLYDPTKHSSVDIKYKTDVETIPIFIFEKGSIIITGVKNCHQISIAYYFINIYLLSNYTKIIKNYLSDEELIKCINDSSIIINDVVL